MARQAMGHVIEGFRSPLEIAVYLLLCLPLRLGGYGLPTPHINAWLAEDGGIVERGDPRAARQADCLWLCDARHTSSLGTYLGYILETQGCFRHFGEHAETGKAVKDIQRLSELQAMGYYVGQTTMRQIESVRQFHRDAMTIFRVLGLSFREPNAYDWKARRLELRNVLGLGQKRVG